MMVFFFKWLSFNSEGRGRGHLNFLEESFQTSDSWREGVVFWYVLVVFLRKQIGGGKMVSFAQASFQFFLPRIRSHIRRGNGEGEEMPRFGFCSNVLFF